MKFQFDTHTHTHASGHFIFIRLLDVSENSGHVYIRISKYSVFGADNPRWVNKFDTLCDTAKWHRRSGLLNKNNKNKYFHCCTHVTSTEVQMGGREREEREWRTKPDWANRNEYSPPLIRASLSVSRVNSSSSARGTVHFNASTKSSATFFFFFFLFLQFSELQIEITKIA